MIILILGAVAIFVWSKLSPTMPTEKTQLLDMPEPPRGTDVLDTLKEGAKKIAAIVGGGGGIATAIPAGGVVGAGGIVGAAFPLTALPAATVLPAGLSAMAPTTLASATYGVTPTVVGTGTGSSSIGAGVGGSSGVGAALGGAALVAAPLVVVPLLAKALDAIFGIGKSGLHDDPELLARQLQITKEKMEMVATAVPGGAVPSWNPKTGFYEGEGG